MAKVKWGEIMMKTSNNSPIPNTKKKRVLQIAALLLLSAAIAGLIWLWLAPPALDVELYRMNPASDGIHTKTIQSDGQRLFLVDRASGNRIYRLEPESGSLKKLAEGPAYQLLLDGKWLYSAESGRHGGIYRMDKDGKHRERIFSSSTPALIGIEDGVLYLLDGDANYAIKKLNLQTGALSTLTTDSAGQAVLQGGKLYYVNLTKDWSLEVMNLDGSDVHTLVERDVMEFFFVSEGILTRSERGQIDLHLSSAQPGDPPIMIVSYVAHAETIDDRLFYSLDDGTINHTLVMTARSLVRTPEIRLVKKPDPPAYGDFFIAGDWLYYYDRMNVDSRLHRFKLSKGFSTPITPSMPRS
ncbi:hypothetical protein B9G55_10910 [Saccharibacillus sp. O16]|nr:hypothetical protein B9G55_10910 [Saccharibacillus sp. O16]